VATGELKQLPDADGDFPNAPIFNFNDGQVKFNTNWVSNANSNYGSASGLVVLPKSFLQSKKSIYLDAFLL
jgi:hypothetical protein